MIQKQEDPLPRRTKTNPAIGHFDNFETLYAQKTNIPLTNIYTSHPGGINSAMPAKGTVVLMPGYGGSPIETWVLRTKKVALAAGFNVVVIENPNLSATAGIEYTPGAMRMMHHSISLSRGLKHIMKSSALGGGYNIASAHSMSCPVLERILLKNPEIRDFFNEIIMNNPYFLTRKDIFTMQKRMYDKDPSGALWHKATTRTNKTKRIIDGIEYEFPVQIKNLIVSYGELPAPILSNSSMGEFVQNLDKKLGISSKASHIKFNFVLSEKDELSEFGPHYSFIQKIPVKNKLHLIEDADHNFENDNAPDMFESCAAQIFKAINFSRMHSS